MTSTSSNTVPALPTPDQLMANLSARAVYDVLHAVVQSERLENLQVEVETAAKAATLLSTVAIANRGPSDNTNANSIHTSIHTSTNASSLFVASFCSAVWLLTLQHETLSAPVLSVLQAVLTADANGNGNNNNKNNNNETTNRILTSLLQTTHCPFLTSVDLLDPATDLSRKLRVTNTAVNYRQHKFNLLAEESEGYSKLLHYLWTGGGGGPVERTTTDEEDAMDTTTTTTVTNTAAAPTITEAATVLAGMIGTYSLDPNRCLDLCVDVVQQEWMMKKRSSASNEEPKTTAETARQSSTRRLAFLKDCMVPLISTTKLPQLLGFKLQQFTALPSASQQQQPQQQERLRRRQRVAAVLDTMSWLVHQGLLRPTGMLPFLPDPAHYATVTLDVYEARQARELKRLQSVGKVSLSGATDDAASADPLVDLTPLSDLLVVQWVESFMATPVVSFPLIVDCFEDQWSDWAVLFPTTVGVAILDFVDSQLQAFVQAGDGTIPELLSSIAKPLEFTRESGCMKHRPILYSQLCRCITKEMKQNSDARTSPELIEFIRIFLLPSLCVFTPNPAISQELWKVMEQLPYRTRYSLYRSWRGDGLERAALKTNKPLWLIEGELLVGKDARYSLKRLSKETLRDISRAVAKCCNIHPLVVFTTILGQIEAYDNLIQVMVDACRFVTPLSLDVLGFCILERLNGSAMNTSRSSSKENGVGVSQWLQSLEAFTGAFFKRYPNIENQGILYFLIRRLKEGHVTELGVLRTLLKSAAGWNFADYAPAASLSSTQLEGRAGSAMLIRETMTFGVVEDVNQRASNELRKVLQHDKLGVSLLILMSQVRHQIVFAKSGRPKPIKLIGNQVDTCQVVISILLDFLTSEGNESEEGVGSSIQHYANALPSFVELCESYKLDVQSAWFLCRPLIRASKHFNEGDDGYGTLTKFLQTAETRKSYVSVMPASVWLHLTPELFETFYSTTASDIFCPEDVYVGEISRLDKENERLSQKKAVPQQAKDKEELERVKAAAAKLATDYAEQTKHVESVHDELSAKARDFFESDSVSVKSTMTFFVRCVYPRCMQGPDEAMFCAGFVSLLHHNETPGFGTLHYFDSLLVALPRAMYCMTEGEAACASILLVETWKTVSNWRYDDDAFQSDLVGKPGSSWMSEGSDGENKCGSVSKEKYTELYNKWHAAIGSTCIGCLKSAEYMHLRNCLVVLSRMVEVYPTRPRLANVLIETLEPLQAESNAFADIRANAQAYHMQLIKARDDGVWKEEDAATVKARLAKVEAAAAARHKKAEATMAQIKRDNEKITEEIGNEWDQRGDQRSRGRAPQQLHAHPQSRSDDRRGGNEPRRGGPSIADDRRGGGGGNRPPPPRDSNVQILPPVDRWQRDRASNGPAFEGPSVTNSKVAPNSERPIRGRLPNDVGVNNRKLEGRWTPGNAAPQATPSATRKRGRASSPVEQGESRETESSAAKRPRPNEKDDSRGNDEARRRGDGGNRNRRRR